MFRKHIDEILFSEKVLTAEDKKMVDNFSTGTHYPEAGLADYLRTYAIEDIANGEGVTHLIINKKDDSIIGYYTLVSSALPYYYRTNDNGQYYQVLCGIPAIEVRMFAIDESYQDVFIGDTPISAIVFRHIVDYVCKLSETSAGIKAIYLHTLPSAQRFYEKNGMQKCEKYFVPFASEDDDLLVMYALINECNIVYEE